MEAKLVDALPEGEGWQFEPKWDGFRCIALRDGPDAELHAKSGKTLTRYFPEVVAELLKCRKTAFAVDGELVIPVGRMLSFDALQMRLHPAESRIRRLSLETPALLVLFDCLADAGTRSLIKQPLTERRAALESLFATFPAGSAFRLTPYVRKVAAAQKWLDRADGILDGVVAKRIDGPYVPGERAMLKVKRMRTADCVVGGFRYATDASVVGSLLLGLYDDQGRLNHVGFTSAIARKDRPALTRKLEKMIEPPGFTGSAPGGPSRWSTERSAAWEPLRPELVVEVRFDQVTGDRFRHGAALLRWRPDKAPRQCTMEQMRPPARVNRIVREILSPPSRPANP